MANSTAGRPQAPVAEKPGIALCLRSVEEIVKSAGSGSNSILSPEARVRGIERLDSEEFDLAVVGGGVTGGGIALDAVARGLRVALVEQGDFGQGTSSRSSRLIHGGLRYLEHLDIGVVRQALRERHLLSTTVAPHLVRPIPFLFALTHIWERGYVGAGLLIYDQLAARSRDGFPRHQHLGRAATFAAAPSLHQHAVRGSIRYWDAQVDDARLTLSIVRTAAALGAVVVSRARAVDLELGTSGAVIGVECEPHHRLGIRARHVVVAAGVWSNNVFPDLDNHENHIQPSKGIHIVVPGRLVSSTAALITRTRTSVLFVIPWDDVWLIGTTDSPWDGEIDSPTATRDDVAYLLDQANRLLDLRIGPGDVMGAYAGLRALARDRGKQATVALSRRHRVFHAGPPVSFVVGGKLTTYRSTAADVVDDVAERREWALAPSSTEGIPLVGAAGFSALWTQREAWAARCGVGLELAERFIRTYGAEAVCLLKLCRDMPELGRPIGGETGVVGAEIVHAVSREGALHLDDVLFRRTRVGVHRPDAASSVAGTVAEIAGDALGWSTARRREEVAGLRAQTVQAMEWRGWSTP